MKTKCYVGEWNARPIGCACDPNPFPTAHPRDFAECVKKWEEEYNGVDIWTNNICLVNHFPPENVVVCIIDKNGKPQQKTLDQHPKWEKWKYEFSCGEFWSMYGEGWILENV